MSYFEMFYVMTVSYPCYVFFYVILILKDQLSVTI